MLLTCHVQVNFYLPRLLPQARISACSPAAELQQEDDCEGGSPDCFVNDTITLTYAMVYLPVHVLLVFGHTQEASIVMCQRELFCM